MNTAERAQALSDACGDFRRLLVPTSRDALLDLVRIELGHEGVLDGFQAIGGGEQFLAIPAPVILHIVSGNTPHAALQTLIRGLLLGSHNLCKLPTAGLPEPEAFVAKLPNKLRARVEFSTALPPDWLARADAIIVYGSDETIAHFRALAQPHQTFLAYGHRISLGMVFEDANFDSAPRAARDASLFDQQGCLSPHCIYVAGQPAEYAARLAVEMERIQRKQPRSPLTLSEAAAIAEVRETTRFRIAIGQELLLWESDGSDAWTVIFDADSTFSASVLNRVIHVRPMPENPVATLASIRPHLSTIAIWPNLAPYAQLAAAVGASRICALGAMQDPGWTWRHDGRQTLAPLVTWRGWEP
jgi:hypothetical protein